MRPLRFVFLALALVAAAVFARPAPADPSSPGIHVEYYNGWMRVTLEGSYAMAGTSVDDRGAGVACTAASTTTFCDSTDQAAAQKTFTVSTGFDF